MNLIELSLLVAVGIVCGTIAQLTSSHSKGGWILYPAIAFFGAFAGLIASSSLNAPVIYNLKVDRVNFPIIYCILGAVFFLAAVGLFLKPGRR